MVPGRMDMRFERLGEFTLEQLGTSVDALDGPFVMPSGTFAFLVSLRGRDGGAMPSPSELHWRRDVPPAIKLGPVPVFLRRGDRAIYLGAARLHRRGKPTIDGFKVAFEFDEPLEPSRWREFVEHANAPPPPAPEEALARLGHHSTLDARVAAMRTFVERWHGPTPTLATADVEIAPPALRALHQLTSGRNVCAQNRLLARDELVPEGETGMLVFYVENQGVCHWASELHGDDPPVHVRWNEADAPWRKESDTLSTFLIGALVLEATFGAPFGASHPGLDARAMARLAKRVRPLPVPPWAASRTRFLGSDGVIGFAAADGDDFSVWLGARDRVRMEPLERLLSDWPDVRF